MSIETKGYSGNILDVNAQREALVALTLDAQKAGIAAAGAVVHSGGTGAERLVREADASPDYRLRVGLDTPLWNDVFNHTQMNLSKYKCVTSTMTAALAGGGLTLNNGNSVAAAAVANIRTYRTFPLFLSYAVYTDIELLFTQDPTIDNVNEFGMFYASGTATPTDGVFFRLAASGALLGVINNNGSEVTVTLDYDVNANVAAHGLIVTHNDRAEFWIDDVLYGAIDTPNTLGSPSRSMSLPLAFRSYNAGGTAVAQQMKILSASVSMADMNMLRLWPTVMAGMGNSAVKQPDSVAAGQTANYANTAAPASATLSNTAAGYTTLGGQFQFAAVAGAETDYALFAFQVPDGSAAVPGKTLMVRGIRIESFNMGAAVATTPTLLQWGVGFGSTAVSLATADSATAGTRAPRRITMGVQSLPIGAVVGYAASPVDINFDAPEIVEPGTFIHIILKIPVGTATASQIVRGVALINGYFE